MFNSFLPGEPNPSGSFPRFPRGGSDFPRGGMGGGSTPFPGKLPFPGKMFPFPGKLFPFPGQNGSTSPLMPPGMQTPIDFTGGGGATNSPMGGATNPLLAGFDPQSLDDIRARAMQTGGNMGGAPGSMPGRPGMVPSGNPGRRMGDPRRRGWGSRGGF